MKPYYEESGIVIYHGDCRDYLPLAADLSLADLLLTDPPYGIAHASSFTKSHWKNQPIANDDDTSLRDWVLSRWPRSLPAYCFGSWKRPRPVDARAILIWDKGAGSGMGDLSFPWKQSHEEIYVIGEGFFGSRDEGVLKGFSSVGWGHPIKPEIGRIHPNQKPDDLIRYLISKTRSRCVLDPFMGSGTTLRAAKDLGRRAIGIEIEERYCEIAAKRLSQAVFDFGAAR